jgi:DNA-binding transcriptional ArsR family regulator
VTTIETIAQPTRLEIVRLIWDRERAASEIAAAFDLSFGAVSQHLRVLREAGVVTVRREWRQRFYQVRKESLGVLADYLESMWQGRLGVLKRVAEAERRARAH